MKKVASPLFAEIERQYLTTEEAAQELGMSARTLEDWRRRGRGPLFIKRTFDGVTLYKRSELVAWYFRFEETEVRAYGAQYEVNNPKVTFELHLYGDKLQCLAPNVNEAVKKIGERITKDIADGTIRAGYSYCGIKADVILGRNTGHDCALCVFSAE